MDTEEDVNQDGIKLVLVISLHGIIAPLVVDVNFRIQGQDVTLDAMVKINLDFLENIDFMEIEGNLK